MVTYQTAAQNSASIRFGSAKVEVGATVGSLVNLGLATGIEFTEESEQIVLKPDNAPEIVVGVKNHTATVKFEMWELDLANLNLIRGGIDTYAATDTTPVAVTAEAHTLTGVAGVRLNYKNGDNSIVTISAATDTAGTTAVANTDYVAYVDSAGYTCVARVAASTVITSGDGIKVTYTYTPLSAKTLSTGGLNTIAARVVRLTNTNGAGKVFRITVYAAKNSGGINLQLPADDADDPLKPTIELRGVVDTTRTAGDQLFEIYDEQGV